MDIGPKVVGPKISPILAAGSLQGEEYKKVKIYANNTGYQDEWDIEIHQDKIEEGHEDDSKICNFKMTGLSKAEAGKTNIKLSLWVDERTGMLQGEGWELNAADNAVRHQLTANLDFHTIPDAVIQ